MIFSPASVPERQRRGNEFDGGGNQASGVSDCREPVGGAEIAGDVDGDEEQIGLVGVPCSELRAGQQRPVDGDFRGEQVGPAAGVGEPAGVVSARKVVDVNFDVDSRIIVIIVMGGCGKG